MKVSTSYQIIYKVFFILSACVILSPLYADNLRANLNQTPSAVCSSVNDSDVTIRILCTGDIMVHKSILNTVKTNSKKTYNFLPVLKNVAPLLRKGDITIGNLETVFAGDELGFSGYPTFNSPQVLASDLRKTGFTVLTTSNNHSFDQGTKGLKKTIQVLNFAGLKHTGTFADTSEKKRSIILNVKGCRIGLLSYTYGTNGELSKRIERHINLIDTADITNDIDSLHKDSVDFIITSIHFGNEYQMNPSESQKSIVHFLWTKGVQIVFGHHPHVLQPFIYDSTANRFAIFSLGNFISSQHGDNKEYGGIADITIEKTKNDSSFHIKTATVHLTYILKAHMKSGVAYRILTFDNPDKNIFTSRYQRYFSFKADTVSFFNNHLHSLDGLFSYADNTKTIASDGGR